MVELVQTVHMPQLEGDLEYVAMSILYDLERHYIMLDNFRMQVKALALRHRVRQHFGRQGLWPCPAIGYGWSG